MSVRLAKCVPGCASVRPGHYCGAFADGNVETRFALDIHEDRTFTLTRKSVKLATCTEGEDQSPALMEKKYSGTARADTREDFLEFDHQSTGSEIWTDFPPTYSKVGCGAVQIKAHVENRRTFPEEYVRLYLANENTNENSCGTCARCIDKFVNRLQRLYQTVFRKRYYRARSA